MLRLTRKSKSRISNSLAILATLMLIVTALADVDNPASSAGSGEPQLTGTTVIEDGSASIRPNASVASKKNKRFKMSLFLFRP